MIDTMNIFHRLTRQEYEHLIGEFGQLSYSTTGIRLYRDRLDRNARVTNCLKDFGIRNLKLRYRPDKDYRAIEMVVQPKLLFNHGDYLSLTSIGEMEAARVNFNSIFCSFGLPDFIHWKTKRFDCAIDLELDPDLVSKYMFLINKSNIPDFLKKHILTEKYLQDAQNFYLCSSGIRVNFYDRYTVLQNKVDEGLIPQEQDIETAKGKIRLEVQRRECNGELHRYLDQSYCQKTVEGYFNRTVGQGDYLSLDKALLEVSKQVRGITTKIELRNLLRIIYTEGTVWGARAALVNSSSNKLRTQKTISDQLALLRKLNINPVTIPESMELQHLPGLSALIRKKFEVNEE